MKQNKTTSHELFLWQRYTFNRDIGDYARAEYWAKRIEEYKLQLKK